MRYQMGVAGCNFREILEIGDLKTVNCKKILRIVTQKKRVENRRGFRCSLEIFGCKRSEEVRGQKVQGQGVQRM